MDWLRRSCELPKNGTPCFGSSSGTGYRRMKAIRRIATSFALISLFFFLPACSIGQTFVTKATNEKLAVYDARQIMLESDLGKMVSAEFKKLFNEHKEKIQNVEKDLRTRKDYLEKNRSLLSDKDLKELENDYQKRFKEYQELVKYANETLKKLDDKLVAELTPHILKVVESIKEKEKYTALLDTRSQVTGINYSKDQDITKKVMDEFNRYTKMNEMLELFARRAVVPSNSLKDLPSVLKSDVDELPLIKVKKNNNSYAIVIGIEQYRQNLPKADFAVNDAKLVTEYLTKVMGYPEENVVTLLNQNAAMGDFAKYFEKWLINNVEKGSTIFIYYSGHGAPNPKTSDAYLVPYDGDPSFIVETGYSLKRMYAALGKLPAKEIVVALDSCFSGAGGRSVIAKGSKPLVMDLQNNMVLSKNMTVLTASAGDQTSSTYDEQGHGLFTYFMLKGIKNEDVVRQDGSIKIDDLFSYIKPQVERIARKQYNNEQTPQLTGAKNN